jgi:hypothetical protein
MTTSNKWRLLITANAGYSGQLCIGDWQLRTTPGVARPFVQQSMTASVNDGGAASLLGAASLTEHISTYTTGDMVALTLPFNINVGGLVTNQVVVNSYGMVSFGHDGTSYGYEDWLDEGNAIPYPFIAHGMGQGYGGSAFQHLYAGAENSGSTYRIRLEMFAGWEDPGDGTVNTVWEVTFDSAQPDRMRIDFGTSGYAAITDGGGVMACVGDGVNIALVAQFPSVVNKQYTLITGEIPADGVVAASSADSFNPPSGAIDGVDYTSWVANMTPSVGTPGWIEYTFTSPQTIAEYTIAAPSSYYSNPLDSLPKDWTLQYWDGSAWQVQDTQTNQTGWSYDQVRTFAALPPSNDGDVLLPLMSLSAIIAAPDAIIGDNMTTQPLSLSGTLARAHDGQVNLGNPLNLGPLYNATPFTLAAVGERGALLTGEATFEELLLEGSLEPALPLPGLTLAAQGVAGTVATASITLSFPSLEAVTLDPITLSALGVAATGVAGTVGTVALGLPYLDAAGTFLTGTAAAGDVRVGPFVVDASFGTAGDISLAQLGIAATAVTGTAADASILFNRATLDASGLSDQLPTAGEAILLPLDAAGTMLAGQIGQGAANLLAPTLAAIGQGDAVLDGALLFDPLLLAGSGLAGPVANGALTLSPWTVAATGSAPLPDNNGAGAALFGTLQGAGVLLAGRIADGAVTLAAPILLATLVGDQIADGALALRAPSLAATATNNPAGVAPGEASGALSLPDLTLAATATTGTLASGDGLLPRLQVDADLLGERIGTGAVAMSALLADARMVESAAAPATGSAAFPVLQAAAAMFGDTTADASLPLPRLGVSGTMPPELIGAANAALPVLLVDARMIESAAAPANGAANWSIWQIAATMHGGTIADGNLPLPRFGVLGTMPPELIGDANLALPALHLAGALIESAAAPADAGATLPAFQLAATLAAGGMVDGAALLRAPVVAAEAYASTEASADLRLPQPGLAAFATADSVTHGAVSLRQLEADGNLTATIEGAATLRQLDLVAFGNAAAVIHGDVQLVAIETSAAAVPGNIAMASITVPLLHVDADGYLDTVGTATVALPLLAMEGVGIASVPAPVFTAVAVNTRNQAATTYEGLGFNSVTSFNGMVLAATADGIVALAGDTDQGAPIAAMLASGVTSMDSEQMKRVLCGYAGYSATGNLELTLITDTHHEYVYALVPEQVGQLHAARVKFGRGVEGRYWQWKLANKAGAHFALDKLTLDVSPLSRRT